MASAVALWTLVIEGQLIHLQVVQHAELVALAERQQQRTVTVHAKRGEVLDRDGRVLAYSVDADSIYAVPTEVQNPARTAALLCAVLDDCEDPEPLTRRLRQPKPFAYVGRQVSPDEARRVADLNLEGVGFHKENRRYYPNKELAAHLLGYVGIDSQGLNGVESKYDAQIRGRPGKILIRTDARRRAFSRIERPPTVGASIELTIDKYLQHIVERELRSAVRDHRADGGTIVVMDPSTGDVLALANEPTFNPNAFARFGEVARRNRAVQDMYEPGSVFKVVTASAALEEKIVDLDEPFDVSAGLIRIGSRLIYDVSPHGSLSFGDVIVKSSNVGTVKVGLRLGSERLGRYIHRFGFGQTLSRDFQGENPGKVWDAASLDDSALASVAIGYQVAVTPLQLVSAVSAVANGGELLEPRVVRAIMRDGVRIETPRRVIRRAISEETAAELTAVMEAVTERGTARAARIQGHTVAGKTGTAQKVVSGGYSKSQYYASFVGFVPSRDPALTIVVVIDSPRTGSYYGGAVAAPVFKAVATAALRQLAVAPTLPARPRLVVTHRTKSSHGSMTVPVSVPAVPRPATVQNPERGLMPDLRGMSAREALRALARIGVTVALEGDGVVVSQQPPSGAVVERGEACALRLERWPMKTGTVGVRP